MGLNGHTRGEVESQILAGVLVRGVPALLEAGDMGHSLMRGEWRHAFEAALGLAKAGEIGPACVPTDLVEAEVRRVAGDKHAGAVRVVCETAVAQYGRDMAKPGRVQVAVQRLADLHTQEKDRKSQAAAGLSFVRASDVQVEQVEWLSEGRIAFGKITVTEGDPGVGKTTLMLDVGASVTRGKPPMGQGKGSAPRNVLVFSGEDGLGDTLKPRLLAAGADCDRVFFEDVSTPEAQRLMLPRDIPLLEAKVAELRAGLVIIDPVMSYLDPEVDSHKDQEVRTALMPLAAMAQRTGVAVVLIRHLNKGTGLSALYRGGGSIAFAGVARLVLLAAKDPDAPDSYVLARVKGNLGRPPPALCYGLGGAQDGAAAVRWGGTSTLTPDELLAPPKPGPKPDALDQAEAYLRDLLSSGPKLRRDVLESAAKVHLSERTIERARRALDVQSTAQGKERLWSLP